MGVIFTRAPLRISLGGGGTDLPSYYLDHGGFLVAAAIDKYVYMLTHTAFQQRYRLKYSQFEEVDDPRQIRHPILREALVQHWRGSPLEIASVADVPAGTGLGSSGAFGVCLLKALALGAGLATTPASLAERACRIEMDLLNEPVGKQDPYVAAHGGIGAYTFDGQGVDVRPILLSSDTLAELQDKLLLFYTGESRSAAHLLADQQRRTQAGDAEMITNLHRTKEIGRQSCALLEAGELEGYGKLLDEHWQNKRQRSPGIAGDRAETLYEIACRSGALGGKLVGAGGGGFLLVFASRPHDTRQAMTDARAPELRFEFEFHGCAGTEYR